MLDSGEANRTHLDFPTLVFGEPFKEQEGEDVESHLCEMAHGVQNGFYHCWPIRFHLHTTAHVEEDAPSTI